jgi:hypothetical protein
VQLRTRQREDDGLSPAASCLAAPPRRRLGSGLLLGLSDAYTKGGASIWQTPTIDPELGLIYFSTGNAHPDFNEGKPDPVTRRECTDELRVSLSSRCNSASHSLVEVTVVSTSWNRQ